MKRKAMIAIVIAIVMIVSTVSVFAMAENANSVTARFSVAEVNASGNVFSMVSENGEYTINISDDTRLYFDDYVPLSDESEDVTRDVREVLFDRTVAEVLDGRNLLVVFGENNSTEPISITVLFETAVPLENASSDVEPVDVPGFEGAGIMAVSDEVNEGATNSANANLNPGTGRA